LTLASKEYAISKQTDADVASFDLGYSSAYFAFLEKRDQDFSTFPCITNC
jgi:1,4-dihydroxy-2-naphthoyl-CoA synthase